MTNSWIITDRKFFKHKTLAEAEQERNRLISLLPKKSFRVHRVKGTLQSKGDRALLKEMGQALEILLQATMYKDHPVESQKAIEALKKWKDAQP